MRTRPQVELEAQSYQGQPYETVAVRGTVLHAKKGTMVRVLYREAGRWRHFPIPATVDASGRFTAFVELGRSGDYALRVQHPETGAKSGIITLSIS